MKKMVKALKKYYVKRDGFISSYFIYLFMIITLCLCIITNKTNYDNKTIYNLHIYSDYFTNEYVIINHIKKELLKEEELLDSYLINNHIVDITNNEDTLIVSINGEYTEVLELFISDNKIMKYEAYRDVDDIFTE